ncbi:septum formation initiator [Sulfurospirillum sp. 1612]|uniref:septum formation initiator n=1 Tax=Sulfurospirillum sp. 1612 TaxID=3094835 RepID=UPI002F92D51C
MSTIVNELDNGAKKKFDTRFYSKVVLLLLAVIVFGVYVGNVLFGKSSLEVLLGLQESRDTLKANVRAIKAENALLQKDYFELKQLEPTN